MSWRMLSPTISDSVRRGFDGVHRGPEDALVRFHEAVLGRRNRDGDESVQFEMRLKRREAAM